MLVACQFPHEHHVPAEHFRFASRGDGAYALAQRVRSHFARVGGQNKDECGQSRYRNSQHGFHATPASQARGPGVR